MIYLMNLPVEMIDLICQCLDTRSLMNFSLIGRYFALATYFWRLKYRMASIKDVLKLSMPYWVPSLRSQIEDKVVNTHFINLFLILNEKVDVETFTNKLCIRLNKEIKACQIDRPMIIEGIDYSITDITPGIIKNSQYYERDNYRGIFNSPLAVFTYQPDIKLTNTNIMKHLRHYSFDHNNVRYLFINNQYDLDTLIVDKEVRRHILRDRKQALIMSSVND